MIKVQIVDVDFDVTEKDLDISEFDGFENNNTNGVPTPEFVQQCIDNMREALQLEVLDKVYEFDDEDEGYIDELISDAISDDIGWCTNYLEYRILD